MSNKDKNRAWDAVTDAVNAVSLDEVGGGGGWGVEGLGLELAMDISKLDCDSLKR